MPHPDRLLRTLRQAVRACDQTTGRTGHLLCLDDADEVFVAGDLHGNLENFRRLLACAALGDHPGRHLVMQELVHGPHQYPNGSDKSHQLVDLMAALKCQYPERAHLLLGNHELAQWQGHWIAKGNLNLIECFRAGVETAYGDAAAEIYDAYLEFFARTPLAIRAPNRLFMSHSLPSSKRLESFDPAVLQGDVRSDKDLTHGGAVYSLLWGRDTQAATATRFLELVNADHLITGHIPCPRGFDTPNDRQLILDCMGEPAAYCLFPAKKSLTHEQIVDCVHVL
jgi:hypothetical protein